MREGLNYTLQWLALGEKRLDSRADWCAREISSRQTVHMPQNFILSFTSENRPLHTRMQGGTKLHSSGQRSVKNAQTRARIGASESWEQGR
jgi:hypothetical protein